MTGLCPGPVSVGLTFESWSCNLSCVLSMSGAGDSISARNAGYFEESLLIGDLCEKG